MEENLPKFENREELVVNSDMAIDLRKAMSWAKFLSIMMFIGTGMMFLLSIVCFAVDPSTWFDNDMEPGAGGILGGVYLAVTVIYFFLSYFMYMFSVKIKRAIADGDKAAFQRYPEHEILFPTRRYSDHRGARSRRAPDNSGSDRHGRIPVDVTSPN